MIDRITKVFHASPDRLARLVAADRAGQEDWEPADLKMIWEHQLAAPLQTDLEGVSLPGDVTSFADLLHGNAPPVSVLRQAMDFAHAQCSEETGVLPREIARVSGIPRYRCDSLLSRVLTKAACGKKLILGSVSASAYGGS